MSTGHDPMYQAVSRSQIEAMPHGVTAGDLADIAGGVMMFVLLLLAVWWEFNWRKRQ
ncbi:hypothetical protein [Dyella jiangningensis]